MYSLRLPDKIYFKKGCMPIALDELKCIYNKTSAFIITDNDLYHNGAVGPIENKLNELNIRHICYFKIDSTPDLSVIEEGARAVQLFEPDVIIAFGSGAAIDAAKLMRLKYEYPDADLFKLSSDFNDITLREKLFPKQGTKALLVAVPDISGNASEVSPYAVFFAENEEMSIADYELMPDIAVVDGDFMLMHTRDEAIKAGLNSLVRSINAYDSFNATEYTDGFVIEAVENIFRYLPEVIEKGAEAPVSCEKLGEAVTMSAIAYSNTASIINVDDSAQYLAEIINTSAAESEEACSRYAELGAVLGLNGNNDSETVEKLVNKIKDLVILCGSENKQLLCS